MNNEEKVKLQVNDIVYLNVGKYDRDAGYNPGPNGTKCGIISFDNLYKGLPRKHWPIVVFMEGDREGEEDMIFSGHLSKEWPAVSRKDIDMIVWAIGFLAQRAHQTAVEHGFWPEGRPDTEFIALAHSELSEALEALRSGNPESEKIPGHSNLAEELADTVIRILDFAYAKGIELGPAILAKMEYNEGRPHKHGRKF
jgi:NTP pyrophosphatase (non-canonical NTP hydrolase)